MFDLSFTSSSPYIYIVPIILCLLPFETSKLKSLTSKSMVRAIFKSPPVVWQGRGKTERKEKGREEKNEKDMEGFFSPSASLGGGRFFLLGDTV